MTEVISSTIVSTETNATTAKTVTSNAPGEHRNHLARFKKYLQRNIGYVQKLVESSDHNFSEEVCKQALHTLSYAIGQRELWQSVRMLFLALAPKMELAEHREDWLPYLRRGLVESKQMADIEMAAECEFQIGLTYRLLSDFASARRHLTNSIALAKQCNEPRIQARSLNELAWLEQLQEEFAAAQGYVDEALQLLAEDDPERAISYRVMGMIAFGHQDWNKAEALHREALRRFEQDNDLRRMAWSMQNLAYTLYAQQKFHEAIDLYKQAIKFLKTIGDRHALAIVFTNLGLAYHNLAEDTIARDYYYQAQELTQELQDKLLLARLYTNLGLSHLALHDYSAAADNFQQSANIHTELGNLSLAINSEDGLVMALIALQRYRQAMEVAERALLKLEKVKDSPRYRYLHSSLRTHLEEATQAKMGDEE